MPDETANEFLDLSGVPCPANTARVLLKLELMFPGSLLEAVVDDGEPALSVPESLDAEGYRIIRKNKQGSSWILLIEA